MQNYMRMCVFFLVICLLLWVEINCGALKTSNILESALTNDHDNPSKPSKKLIFMKKLFINQLPKEKLNVEEKFRHLPEDDLEFIRELDKQFTMFGAKVKIKVQSGNETNKTSTNGIKRNLDAKFGYGYSKTFNDNSPKYIFHPYSQEYISLKNSNYHFSKHKPTTTVTIEPSYSFELESEAYIQPSEEKAQKESTQISKNNKSPEPIIILNIPGPKIYANHLMNLLQQYLEVKTAEHLRILREEQLQNCLQHNNKQLGYKTNNYYSLGSLDNQHNYESHNYRDPLSYTQNVKNRYYDGNHDGHYYAVFVQTVSSNTENHHITTKPFSTPLLYYTRDRENSKTPSKNGNSNLTQVTTLASKKSQPFDYMSNNYMYNMMGVTKFPLSENNPSTSHTKVIFTKNSKDASSDYQFDYPLPSIKPKEYRVATSIPAYHQDFYIQSPEQHNLELNPYKDHIAGVNERSFNYHARNSKQHINAQENIMILTTC